MVNLLATLSQQLAEPTGKCTRTKFRGSRSGNRQIQQAMSQITEMNSAFQETLSRRFEIVYAYPDLISNVARLSGHATSLGTGRQCGTGSRYERSCSCVERVSRICPIARHQLTGNGSRLHNLEDCLRFGNSL